MKKITSTALVCFMMMQGFAQQVKKLPVYLEGDFVNTISDQTKGNNPWGIGLGLQLFFNNKTRFKPTVELTGDVYLENDKVFRTEYYGEVRSMINLFVGSSFHPAQKIYFSFLAGPSFIHGQTLLGIKPSLGSYFSGSKKLMGKISYIDIFNRGKTVKEDFTSFSLAVAVRLF